MIRRLTARGRVQGVWYRGWAVDQARALGLSGWVRNRRDGSVEMLVSGAEKAIDAFVGACRRGPPAARVERVDVEESGEAVASGFEQRPTA
jgi:acylphosphatase